MSVIVLEGPSGVGKTTLAKLLVAKTSAPIYRAFRTSLDSHKPGEDEADLGTLLPVNSWHEDLYAADVLATLRCPVVLDRSMPSALAYDHISDAAWMTEQSQARRERLAQLWGRRINRAGGIIVQLWASPAVCNEGNGGRLSLRHIADETRLIDRYSRMTGVPHLLIHRESHTPEDILEMVLSFQRQARDRAA